MAWVGIDLAPRTFLQPLVAIGPTEGLLPRPPAREVRAGHRMGVEETGPRSEVVYRHTLNWIEDILR